MSIMLVHFQDKFYADVAERLFEEGVDIRYMTLALHTPWDNISQNSHFSECTLLDQQLFSSPQFISLLNREKKNCLSAELLEEFVQCENLFLSISDRFSFFPVSVQKRKALYQELLLYWYTFLETRPVDAIIFGDVPHMGWDNIVYEIAKKLSIPTLCVERTFTDRVLLLDDFRKIEKVPSEYLYGVEKDDIIRLMGTSLFKDIFESSSWKQISDQRNKDAIEAREHLLNTAKKDFVNIFHKVRSYGSTIFRNLFSSSLLSAVGFNGPYRSITVHVFRFFYKLSRRRLYQFYMNHTSDVDYDRPFVFVALHFQPEKNTTPQGGVFENQHLLVEILAKFVPKDWMIYVKEHPRQFSYQLNSKHYRNQDYYERLLRIGNVKLVKPQEDTERLTERAELTANIKGTAGWQSLLHHKPCIAFGYAWYAPCNSCYIVRSAEECKQAIDAILKKSRADVERDVLKFLAYYKEKFVISSTSYRHAQKSSFKYETLVNNLMSGIIKQLGHSTFPPV